jgi:hemolysin activation/secretion protein
VVCCIGAFLLLTLSKVHVFKKSWLPCVMFFAAHQGAIAQTTPSAGGQMQQLPTVPAPLQTQPLLNVQPRAGVVPASAQRSNVFVAMRLHVRGASAYAESELVHVTGFESGQSVSLQALYDMAEKITQHYRRNGFLVAQAYLPAQEIKDGVVTLDVLEGQYGFISLDNTSMLDSQVPRNLFEGLNPGDVIVTAPLEERLLRLSDVPGVQVRSTLVPGASVGLSDLIVEIKPGDRISGSVDADNAGNRYTGENRIGATVNLNNPSDRGDLITLRVLTSGAGLQYVRAAYQAPVGKGRVGVAYSDLAYKLGHEFAALDANGHARIATLFGSLPLIRSRNTNLNVGLALDSKAFQDRLDAIPSVTDKRAQVLTATLYGDQRDAWNGGGVSTYSLAWSMGDMDIQTPAARSLDASTANSNGQYNKVAFALSRLQQATQTISFLASLSGQVASKNLDVSEKMELGGMYGVRAYPEGEAYADAGYLLTLEARKLMQTPPSVMGQVHLAAFVDTGTVKLSQSPWATSSNSRHLSGAGVGAYWTRARDFSVKAFYARKLGSEDARSAPDKAGRFWVQAVKYF